MLELDMEKPRLLRSTPFAELVGLKYSTVDTSEGGEICNQVNNEIKYRYAEFRDYIDKYDALTPEQKRIAGGCMSYRMALGAVNRTVMI